MVDKACHMITGLCQQVDLVFDMAFAAGTLKGFYESDLDIFTFKEECVPASDSVQYHSNLTEDMRKYALKRAKTKLHDVIEQFTNLGNLGYPDPKDPRFNLNALCYWLQDDWILDA